MKTLMSFILGISLSVISNSSLLAQCGPDSSVFLLQHDTVLYGSGNNAHLVAFPKFDPSLGTLLSADIRSVVGVSYGFVATNTVSLPQSLKVRIGREDDIYSSALTDPLSSIVQSAQINKLVPGYLSYTYGPAYMSNVSTVSITDNDLINFEGAGNVSFDYETDMTVTLTGSLSFDLSFTTVQDTTHFSVTYRYCTASLLSSDLLSFNATAQSKSNVLLNWHQATIQDGRVYGVQVSTDGITFRNLDDVRENNKGFYSYNYFNSNDAKKLFFRIQERNVSGEIKYSNVQTVTFTQNVKGGVHIFPTLYKGGNLQVSFPEKSDWQIKVYASDGRKISDSKKDNAYTAQLQLPGLLGNGIYVVETFNTRSQQRQITRIIVQR